MLQKRFIALPQLSTIIINYARFKLIKCFQGSVLICMIWGGIWTDHLSTHSHVFMCKNYRNCSRNWQPHLCEGAIKFNQSLSHSWAIAFTRSCSTSTPDLFPLHLPGMFPHCPINALLNCSPAEPFIPRPPRGALIPLLHIPSCRAATAVALDAFLSSARVLNSLSSWFSSP